MAAGNAQIQSILTVGSFVGMAFGLGAVVTVCTVLFVDPATVMAAADAERDFATWGGSTAAWDLGQQWINTHVGTGANSEMSAHLLPLMAYRTIIIGLAALIFVPCALATYTAGATTARQEFDAGEQPRNFSAWIAWLLFGWAMSLPCASLALPCFIASPYVIPIGGFALLPVATWLWGRRTPFNL